MKKGLLALMVVSGMTLMTAMFSLLVYSYTFLIPTPP